MAADGCWQCFPFGRRTDVRASRKGGITSLMSGRSDTVYFDAEEGTSHHDHLFVHAYKFTRLVDQSVHSLASSLVPSFSSVSPPPPTSPSGGSWLGTTIPERCAGQGLAGSGCSWSRGDGSGFQIRDSCRNGRVSKIGSSGALYECMSVDVVRSGCKVSEVLGRLVPVPSSQSTQRNGELGWWPGCPLPRVLCVVAQLPEQVGPVFGEHPAEDAGVSIVTIFRIKPETIRVLRSCRWPADLRMFVDFVKAGKTDLPTDRGGSKTSGLMKAVAAVGNLEEVGVPKLLLPTVRKYSGKPCLITKSGTVFKDPSGEWLEIDIDLRRFCRLARTMLVSLRDLLPRSSVHCGFTIQGCDDDELPEGIVCDMWLHNINLKDDPRQIEAQHRGTGPGRQQ
mmetsp:Transcript_80882/g.252293  ORF Transcript_80882/g.252293 Transcript_80882/m.252293 type:complete len:393 (-) Transcript_80882:100-1278(-)